MILDFQDHTHHSYRLIDFVDGSAFLGGVTAPLWWQYIDSFGHFALLGMALVGAALRLTMIWRDFRREK